MKSKVVHALQYSREDKTLTVWYKAGGVYRYLDVSEYLYRRLLLNLTHPWPVLDEIIKKHHFKRITPRPKYPRAPAEKQNARSGVVDKHHRVQ